MIFICVNIIEVIDGKIFKKNIFLKARSIVEIDKVIEIKKTFLDRDGEYFVLVDNEHTLDERYSKKSSVFIPATRAGKEFLESYFPGMVPDVE